MKIRLLILFLITALSVTLAASCAGPYDTETSLPLVSGSEEIPSRALPLSEDMGQEYIDSLIFIGESTTYHLKSRGVLTGGKDTKQVWAPKSGTLTLDMAIVNAKILYPQTGELMTFAEAAARARPKYIVCTFGLNGAVRNIKLGEEYYKRCYLSLIDEIRAASPETHIILQSAFPIAKNMDMSNYSVDADTLNRYIDTTNTWTEELAYAEGLRYLATSEALKTSDGFLRHELQVGDGHHLTSDAYREILYYIRTHGYK